MKGYKISIVILLIAILCSCYNSKDEEDNAKLNKLNLEITQLKKELKQANQLINEYKSDSNNSSEDAGINVYNIYDQSMLEKELIKRNYILSLFKKELERIDGIYDITIDSRLLNIILPETIKIGDNILGLVVTNVRSNVYGYEYNIQFKGEFLVEVTLEYDPMFEQFFGKTKDLNYIAYVSQGIKTTTFLIDDPNKMLIDYKDGDVVKAKFNNYKVRRMNGKPLSDVATIVEIK